MQSGSGWRFEDSAPKHVDKPAQASGNSIAGIDSSQSEREFRNLAAPQFPENRGATIIIEI